MKKQNEILAKLVSEDSELVSLVKKEGGKGYVWYENELCGEKGWVNDFEEGEEDWNLEEGRKWSEIEDGEYYVITWDWIGDVEEELGCELDYDFSRNLCWETGSDIEYWVKK